MAKQQVADRLQPIATGCFWPISACHDRLKTTLYGHSLLAGTCHGS
jgi:hypothetical protein